jgi:taurine---2-oxoglutarate transaminase
VLISDPIERHTGVCVFPGGLTSPGHPLATASVVATIEAMREEGVERDGSAKT